MNKRISRLIKRLPWQRKLSENWKNPRFLDFIESLLSKPIQYNVRETAKESAQLQKDLIDIRTIVPNLFLQVRIINIVNKAFRKSPEKQYKVLISKFLTHYSKSWQHMLWVAFLGQEKVLLQKVAMYKEGKMSPRVKNH